MQLQINHATRYEYNQPVDYALQKVRLRPISSAVQEVLNWDVTVAGGKVEASYTDHYGNHTDLVSADPGTQTLVITAGGQVSTTDSSGVFGKVYGRAPLWHFAQPTPLTQAGDRIKSLAPTVLKSASVLDGLHDLSAEILASAPYLIGKTNATTTAEDALNIGNGVCQDHANIFVSAARLAGLPARYVSGYLMINDRIDQDASHAWAEAHIDGFGWVGFDVSNGVSPDERYVRIAAGRDSGDTAPISGMRLGTADESMVVSLQVQQQ
jgi:transglutaminase-like putative cysteine protease